jgi:hypothetical protein
MAVYELTERLRLIAADSTLFEGIGSKEHRTTTTQGIMRILTCFDEILKEETQLLSRQTSVLDIFELSSGTLTTGHRR